MLSPQDQFRELLNYPIVLAPMVGLTHVAMRKSLAKYLPQEARVIWPTEMLNSRRLPDQELGETPETLKWDGDEGLCPQILGNDEGYIRDSIAKLTQWDAKAVDINMGCPVRKALRHNYGVSLMGDINYASEVVSMAKRHSTIPISVKIRAGHQKDLDYLLNFTHALIHSGASWLCLHPRLASEKRKGTADWSQIKLLKDNLSVPIIGNGDIQEEDDIKRMLEQTTCDAVMIGRALCAKPWLLSSLAKEMNMSLSPECEELIPKNPRERASAYGEYLKDFVDNCFEFFDQKNALKRIRFFVKVGSPWLNFGHRLHTSIQRLESQQEIQNFLQEFFKNTSLIQSSRTQLRY
ncbi:tRNA-dihydrouridine synthase [Bacteriovorax sp. DB6_IX]|uniref:tRNA dihydrouridine synthase n=1 Tax=Bacteriovorax sp. DB6_IX TaxID=1353530 RepID=UPI000389EC02|nr:tRNA-dihydrouridine synthase family protein [Bacteriovorax sp. DB6_IX]EQC51110.1 dihydrouridine synthase [Bacteriovorax sp. DB6_IX]